MSKKSEKAKGSKPTSPTYPFRFLGSLRNGRARDIAFSSTLRIDCCCGTGANALHELAIAVMITAVVSLVILS